MANLHTIVDFFNRKRHEKFLRGEDDKALFIEKYRAFRQVLTSNNTVLLKMADMQEKALGGFVFDSVYLHTSYDTISAEIIKIIDNLNHLSDGKYKSLRIPYQNIDSTIRSKMSQRIAIPEKHFVLYLDVLRKENVPEAGGKFAYLGELKNVLNLPVPDGFAITTYAYKMFSQHNQIEDFLMNRAQDFYSRSYEKIETLCSEVQAMIKSGEFPQEVETEVMRAYEQLQKKTGDQNLHVAVRSSALHEDVMASFAGQYESALNIPGKSILDKYKEIVASQFTPRALFYYRNKGFEVEEMAMAIGVLAMVDAKSSGIIYTRDPKNVQEDTILVNAVWGLGPYAVEGRVPTTNYRIHESKKVTQDNADQQDMMLVPHVPSGTREVPVPESYRLAHCLNSDQLHLMSDYARKAEAHFNHPQDMEWSVDQNDTLFLLQSRPLRIPTLKPIEEIDRPVIAKNRKILIDKGTIVCRGVASGPIHVAHRIEDMDSFPEGGILVIRHTDPEFAAILPKAAALVSDIGTSLGHLATVAREYNLPAIFDTRIATHVLKMGMTVTVDALYGNIYEGIVEELLKANMVEAHSDTSPVLKKLQHILTHITPLNLSDPRSPEFAAKNCKTFHDITRFAHEEALRSIFDISKESHFADQSAKQLISDLPLKWWAIDLEDGIEKNIRGKKVTPDQILSIPMRALWAGMTAKPWAGPPPVKAKEFMDATFPDGKKQPLKRGFIDRNYILIAKYYCNISTRLGFHFSTLEAYVCEDENLNYISLFYTGGGADDERKRRRVDLIGRLLTAYDFRVEKKDDTVFARMEGHTQRFLENRLKILGHTMTHTRQMDMVMFNNAMVDYYYKEMSKDLEIFSE